MDDDHQVPEGDLSTFEDTIPPPVLPSENKTSGDKKRKKKEKKTPHLPETVTPDEPKVDKPSENFPKAASEDSKAILEPRIPKAGDDTGDDGQEKIMDKKGKRKQKNKERKIKNKTQRKEKAMEIQKIKIRKINEVKKAIGMSMPRTIVMKKSQKIKVTKKSVELSMLKAMLIEAMQPKPPPVLPSENKTSGDKKRKKKEKKTPHLPETVTPDEPKVDKPSENFPKAASEDSKAILKPRIPKAGGDTDDDGQEKIMDKKGKRKQKAQRKQKRKGAGFDEEGGKMKKERKMVERCVEPLKEPIQKKKKESGSAEKSTGVLRSPVICVIGRDDTEESAILDYIRRTNVREGEAGGITQQIGATEVAAEAIQMCCKHTKGFVIETMEIPGFLIINKGHESYPKLRTLRGSSLCDFAIVIVDMQHGLEPQTVESLKLLIKEQTPFVIALNRFDLLREYKSKPYNDVYQLLRSQQQHFRSEFEEKMEKIEAQFAEQEIKVTLSNSLDAVNPNYVCMVPISATKGVGIGNLMAFIVNQTQTEYAQRLTFSEKLDANVMEVKQITGLGTSINVILVNGTMRAGDILVLTGTDGAIVTKVQKLLMPKPMREMQTKNSYVHFTKVKGSCGVKVLAKNLEKVVSGLPVYVTDREEEIDYLRQEANNQHVNALRASKKNQEGVFVKASTAGSLEALLDFLKSEKIPYSNAKYVFCDDSTPNDGYSSTSSTSPIDRPREMQPSSSSAIQQHQPKNSTHQNIQMRQTTRSEIVPKPSTLGNQTVILKERRHALTDIMDSEESMNKKKEESELNKLKKLTEELSEKIAVSREQIDLLKVQLQNSTIASDMEEQRLIQRIRELEQNHQAELNQLGVVWNERELVIAGQMFLIEALFPPIQPGGENAEPENPFETPPP